MENTAVLLIRDALAMERQEKGWTKEQQAEHHKIDPVTLWRWENGDTGKAANILIPLVVRAQQQLIEQAA
jgi:transcriptional regulator with XRE-family HTH domain